MWYRPNCFGIELTGLAFNFGHASIDLLLARTAEYPKPRRVDELTLGNAPASPGKLTRTVAKLYQVSTSNLTQNVSQNRGVAISRPFS